MAPEAHQPPFPVFAEKNHQSSRRRKLLPLRLTLPLDHPREEQDHVPPLVHNRRSAIRTRYLARKLMLRCFLATVVPA